MKVRAAIIGTGVAVSLAACGSSANTATNTSSRSSTTSTTTSVVTQVVTKTAHAQNAPRRRAKPKRKRKPAPAPAPAPAATSAPVLASPIMPNVVGKDLDAATAKLDSEGINYALNSNGKHVILKFDWGVCSTSPAAGQPVSGAVVLTLGHFTCGA
jgi:type IV secretory pathway VirB10-like protein